LKITTTDNEGFYRFDELNPGNYVVWVNSSNFADSSKLEGYSNTTLQTSDDIDSDSFLGGENGILPGGEANNVQNLGVLSGTISVGPNISEQLNETDSSADDKGQFDGYANLTVDFGFHRLGLSGTVWSDGGTGPNANNGILDNGENGLPNFRVRLFQTNGSEIPVGSDRIFGTSDDVAGGILSDLNGGYSFQGLAEGDYVVKVERQNIISSLISSITPNDNVDFDNNGSTGSGSDSQFIVSQPITLSNASRGILENTDVNDITGITVDSTLDFGLLLAPTAASVSIRGSVVDSNGHFVNRSRVALLNTITNEVRTAQTNSFGYFSFGDLPAGNSYVITVTHKEFVFEPQIVQPLDDIVDLLIIANGHE
jgi:Carboxypeptidase regulatory-like domain/SdrD B-like domain